MLYFVFYTLLCAGLATGIYGAIDAVRNLKGNDNGKDLSGICAVLQRKAGH